MNKIVLVSIVIIGVLAVVIPLVYYLVFHKKKESEVTKVVVVPVSEEVSIIVPAREQEVQGESDETVQGESESEVIVQEESAVVQEVPPPISLVPSTTPLPSTSVSNPVAFGADVHAIRVDLGSGKYVWYMTVTEFSGKVPLYKSNDFKTWTRVKNLFEADSRGLYQIGNAWYKRLWAPQLSKVAGKFVLTITASKHYDYQKALDDHEWDGSGVFYMTTDNIETGTWSTLSRFDKEIGCTKPVAYSYDEARMNCGGDECQHIMRLDSDIFQDPLDGRVWLSYAWYSNSPTTSENECQYYFGEHIAFVELNASDLSVKCPADGVPTAYVPVNCKVAEGTVQGPENGELGKELRSYYQKIHSAQPLDFPEPLASNIDFRRGKHNEIFRTSVSGTCKGEWCIVEAPSMLRRNGWVYMFFSGSAFDSPNYGVAYIAARTVPELADKFKRIAGQFIIPYTTAGGIRHNFGHGHPVQDAEGNWWFVYHHMNQTACRTSGNCSRDVYLSPIQFVNVGDGLGDVYIKPIQPTVPT